MKTLQDVRLESAEAYLRSVRIRLCLSSTMVVVNGVLTASAAASRDFPAGSLVLSGLVSAVLLTVDAWSVRKAARARDEALVALTVDS